MSDTPKKPRGPSRPTLKKEVFTQTLIETGSEKEALKRSGYKQPTKALYRLRRDDYVQKRIGEILTEKYPDHENDFVKLLKHGYNVAMEATEPRDLDKVIKLLDFHARIKGYNAPTKHARLEAKVRQNLLPEE